MDLKTLEAQTKEADMKLLSQYRKERQDLIDGKGLATVMTKKQRISAMNMLTDAIESYRGYLY